MSTAIDRFKNISIGSSQKDVTHTDKLLPNTELERKEGLEAIIESWKNILLTTEGTSDHDPEYGSNLKRFIFEPADEITKEEITEEIREKLIKFDNRATIRKISIYQLKNRKGFTLDIDVFYKGEEGNLNQTFDENLFD